MLRLALPPWTIIYLHTILTKRLVRIMRILPELLGAEFGES